MSLLVISENLGLFVNILTANDEYSLSILIVIMKINGN